MSESLTQDRPSISPAKFSANLIETPRLPHNLTVIGEAVGDYRVQDVKLVRAQHQATPHILVLDVTAKLGPVEDPHPEFKRIWPLKYEEDPARHRYTKVEIVNGPQRFTIDVIFTL